MEERELAELRAFALEAARAAGRVTLEYFGGALDVERKADRSLVTSADRRAEELLRERLAARCPGDGVIGEELGVEEGSSGRRWTLDPIDGTFGFVHGVPLFSVLIGLLDGGEAVLGVVHLPALKETVAAVRGAGCWMWRGDADPVPARVSSEAAFADALVLATDFRRLPGGHGAGYERLADAGELRTWGDAYGHALVATGRADAMIDPRMKPWDSVPLQPIVEEAGGRFSTMAGASLPAGGSAVSTNGLLHDEVLERLADLSPSK
ncbi:MAG: inositol monophosphatase family protein [Gemmatimonadota bacterium]